MRLADMEEILLAQGWLKIDPIFGKCFDSDLHTVQKKEHRSDMKPDRVIEVMHPGFMRQHDEKILLVLRARIILSI
jgi:molecular chaperone GrpE (heat shock protein)